MSIDHVGAPAVAVVHRWRKPGHDRAYVKLADRDVGYRDLMTGEAVCDRPDDVALVVQVTGDVYARVQASRYKPKHAHDEAPPVHTPSPKSSGSARPAPDEPKWSSPVQLESASPAPCARRSALPDRDLALNVPGQAARARAAALREAAPIHTLVARALGVKTEERNWRIGADGEAEIAARLERLPSEWRQLYAIPVGENGADIDAVLIGPGGVFTINAKKHPNAKVWARGETVKVNGTNQWYVPRSRHEATRAARLLSAAAKFDVEVHGLIAVTGHRGFRVKAQPMDGLVTVLEAGGLAAHLLAQPTVLGDPSISRIYDVARHLATWQPNTMEWADFEQ